MAKITQVSHMWLENDYYFTPAVAAPHSNSIYIYGGPALPQDLRTSRDLQRAHKTRMSF